MSESPWVAPALSHGWGDLEDVEYLRERDTRAALRDLPDEDRLTSFDAYRTRVLALPDAIAVASPARREELCRIIVERVVVSDLQFEAIAWTPPARPLFEKDSGSAPKGIRTPDLHLERVASWASRRWGPGAARV